MLICAHEVELFVAITIQSQTMNSIRFKYGNQNAVCIHPLIGLGPFLVEPSQLTTGNGSNTK